LEESSYKNYQNKEHSHITLQGSSKQGALTHYPAGKLRTRSTHTLPCRETQNKEHSHITLQGSSKQGALTHYPAGKLKTRSTHTLPCREAQNKEHSHITLQGNSKQHHFNKFDHLQILIFLSNSQVRV
jgi:hypothetical protein